MPEGVCEWLEQELESRGIDAVVYTRYVLSLLRKDYQPTELICSKVSGVGGGGRRRRPSRGPLRSDPEQLRRSAAVDCLTSACDQVRILSARHQPDNISNAEPVCMLQKCGIESLVDELCQKLRDFESDAATGEPPVERAAAVAAAPLQRQAADPAARYYAAFPALGGGAQRQPPPPTTVSASEQPPSLAGDEGYSTNSDHETTCDAGTDRDGYCLDFDIDDYEDLPVDIRGLLASPVTPSPAAVRRRAVAHDRPNQHRPYIRCGTNITSSIWSEEAATSATSTTEAAVTPAASSPPAVVRWSDGGDRRTVSLIQLNHGGEASCFMEVPPGSKQPRLTNQPVRPHVSQPPAADPGEDLLTSSRTHFRPIRQETAATSVSATSSGPSYADGTTFAIRGSLERVQYRRTDSGSLYLQCEYDASPKRYLEYRSPELELNRKIDADEFRLHFRVKQNEVYCQTDGAYEGEPAASGGEETPPVKRRVLCDYNSEDDMYFPGDCELLLHDQWPDSRQLAGCSACGGGADVWASCAACAYVPGAGPPTSRPGYVCRLRDELSREGDQLLSDLRRMLDPPEAAPPAPPPSNHDYRKRRHSGALALRSQQLLRPVTL